MRTFDREDELPESYLQTRPDETMNGVTHCPSANLSTSLWNSAGNQNPAEMSEPSTPTSTSPSVAPSTTESGLTTSQQGSRRTHIRREKRRKARERQMREQTTQEQDSLPPFTTEPMPDTKHTLSDELKCLESSNASLARSLAQTQTALHAAQLATRDLAAWTLKERTRMMTAALHQRLLREDYEAVLRQRDEQIVYLLALQQETTLEHARTLSREGEVTGRPMAEECVERINEMRRRVGMLEIDRWGAVKDVEVMEGGSGGQEGGEDGGVEDDEAEYAPPDIEQPASLDAQIDELIAEEKDRLTRAMDEFCGYE